MTLNFHIFDFIDNTLKKKKKPLIRRILKIVGWSLGVLILLLFLLVLFIRSPWGQDVVVQRAVKYVSEKTDSKVEIEKLFLTFDGNLVLNGLYLEDQKGDTLVYSKSLEADVPLLPILQGNGVAIDLLRWEGLKARVFRKDSITGYNFQYLIDAFSSEDEPPKQQADSVSSPMKIVVGDVYFSDFDLLFQDEVMGIDADLDLETLKLKMKKTDLENMDFRASNIALSNTRATFIQSPSSLPPDEDEESPLPFLEVDQLSVENVFVYYQSKEEQLIADLEIGSFLLELEKADLAQNSIDVGVLSLKNSIVDVHMETSENTITKPEEKTQKETEEQKQAFEWPDMEVAVSNIDFERNRINYFVGKQQVEKGLFNADAIALEDLNLVVNDIYLKDKTAGFNLENLSFVEASGLDLKQLELQLAITDQKLNLDALRFHLNNNTLRGKVQMEYTTVATLIDVPDKSKVALNIPSYQLDVKDAFRFQPDLRNNEYVVSLSRKMLSGNLAGSGYLSSLNIPNLNVQWGRDTKISVNGKVQNVTDMDRLKFDIPSFIAQTKRDDLLRFVNEEELGVGLPEDVSVTGYAKGDLEDVYAKAELTTSQGIAVVEGHFENADNIAFDADLKIQEYKLNELLQNDQLGTLSLEVKTSGSGKNINDLNATLDANILRFQLGDYAIKDLTLTSEIIDGKGDVFSKYKDKNIDINLDVDLELDSIASQVYAYLNVKGINLQALGLMDRDVRMGLKLDVDFQDSKDGFDIISTMGDGVVVYDNRTYMLGDLLATAHVRSDTTSVWLDNKILQFSVESNSDPAAFGNAMKRHVSSYFSKQIQVPDSISHPVKLKMLGRVAQAPVLNQVFLVNVKDLDTVVFGAYFDEKARRLAAKVHAPHINYGGNELDSLAFTMDTDHSEFKFDLGFKSITAGPLNVPRTKIKGNQKGEKLNLIFHAEHKDSTLINIRSEITGTADNLRFHVNPEDLILDRKPWQILPDNEIVRTPENIVIKDFELSNKDEIVWLTNELPDVSENHVGIAFDNFKLSEILNYLNPEEELAKGNLNGYFALEDPLEKAGILASLTLEKLNVMDVDLGKMTLDAASKTENRYDFEVAMKEGDVDLDLEGDYTAGETASEPNIDLRINKVKMRALEGFSMGEIRNTEGSFSGQFQISGNTNDLQYKGGLTFKEAMFNITKLNATFGFPSESLRIDNEGLSLDHFTVVDEDKNELVLSGKIGTASFINPTFDLKIDADDFQVLNASKDDNDFLYGTAVFDAHGTLTGDLNIPKLRMEIHVNDNTDITYILPSAAIAIEERDGVVIFVNRENPDAVLTQTKEESVTFTGFDMDVLLKIGKKAKIALIIDQETGDNFEIYGDGDLNFVMNPNGRMTLTGIYDIAGGHYELNLYNLVNRRFELAPSSKVSWAGDPFDAKLDVTAVYSIETSASALMAPVSSGADPAEKGKFRQVLPFDVYLNVDGELEKPEISFDIGMPEDEQGAIGGQVYGRIQQVNQQEDELNRQVFSLLVLNRFYPDSGSDGSGGGFASIARDNLNDAISDQLNVFSDKLLGKSGFELDFGLDSYTDYQGETPEQRTQLDIAAQKKLFDDRLIVRVGSEVDLEGTRPNNEPAPIIGNVSLEYLLTENGRYRLKGFRKSSYENVIDGQTIVSGLALIFTQEFNQFDELWQAILRGETDKEKEARRAAKAKRQEKDQDDKNNKKMLQEEKEVESKEQTKEEESEEDSN